MVQLPRNVRVLVLDGHSRAAVEVVQSLGTRGVAVDVAAERGDAVAFRSRFTCERFAQPSTADSLARWLTDEVKPERYALIVPPTENSLQAFKILGEGSVHWQKALLPSSASLEVALSKQQTWVLAEQLGVPVPRSRLIEQAQTAPEPIGFPCVLKPIHSVVTRNGRSFRLEPVIVREAGERSRQLGRLLSNTSVQEQEYVEGRGVGVECLYAHGRLVWYFVHERVHELPLTGGGSTYRRSARPDAALIAAAKRLLDALNWHGVAMVEFKRCATGEFHLMEINPRLWGSLALAIDAGVDFPWGMWLLANRHPVGEQPDYRVPYYSRYLPGDVDWMKENLKADHRDPLLMTRPVIRSTLEYLRPFVGRESWDHFRWSDPAIAIAHVRQVLVENVRNVRERLRRKRLAATMREHHTATLRRLERNAAPPRSVLFICYGNICRSPFAEQYVQQRRNGISVVSAGFHSEEQRASPDHLVLAAADLGVNMADHRSKRVTRSMIDAADVIVVMDLMNFDALHKEYPEARLKAVSLGLFGQSPSLEIADPYTFSLDQTTIVLKQIVAATDAMLVSLARKPSA